jgi:hypothetical protein
LVKRVAIFSLLGPNLAKPQIWLFAIIEAKP